MMRGIAKWLAVCGALALLGVAPLAAAQASSDASDTAVTLTDDAGAPSNATTSADAGLAEASTNDASAPIAPVESALPLPAPAASTTSEASEALPEPPKQKGATAGVHVVAVTQLGSMGSEQETRCASIAEACSVDSGIGSGVFGHVGYIWNHFGFDVELGMTGDHSSRSQTTGTQERTTGVARFGASLAVRATAAVKNERFRGAFALGPGVSARAFPDFSDFEPGKAGRYVSLAMTADANGGYRLSEHVTIVAGVKLWWEHAGDDVVVDKRHLVSGHQVLLLPYVGFDFGH